MFVLAVIAVVGDRERDTLGEDEVEPFLGKRDEVEAVGDRRAAGHHAHVGRAHGDRLRDLQVPGEEVLVAFDGGGRHARLAQDAVEEPARARPRLAVHQADLGPGDVLRLADAQRISLGDGESFFEVREGHHHHRAPSESTAHEGKVVLAGLLVEEMGAGEVRVPPPEHLQGGIAAHGDPTQPLAGPTIFHVAGEDRQSGIAAGNENVRLQGLGRTERAQADRLVRSRGADQQRIGRGGERERIFPGQRVRDPSPGNRSDDDPFRLRSGSLRAGGKLGGDLSRLVAQPEKLLHAASEDAREVQRDRGGRLAAARLEHAERLPADSRALGKLALLEPALQARAPEPRL